METKAKKFIELERVELKDVFSHGFSVQRKRDGGVEKYSLAVRDGSERIDAHVDAPIYVRRVDVEAYLGCDIETSWVLKYGHFEGQEDRMQYLATTDEDAVTVNEVAW